MKTLMPRVPDVPEVPDVPGRLVVLAPNWLGDAVLALPVITDLHRAWPDTTIAVAARASVAPLYSMVPAIREVVALEVGGGLTAARNAAANARRLAAGAFDAALLLPNSFLAAWLAWRAGIPDRWGIVRDLRGPLLTRRVARPRAYRHQIEYYQSIVASLGLAVSDPFAGVSVPPSALTAAQGLLREAGLGEGQRFVVFAPGAAYGRAKQWLPARFAELAIRLGGEGTTTVLVGAGPDRAACQEIARMAPVVDLSGRTDLPTLAALMASAAHVVVNDSGAMHLAAAVGAPLTAIFGPTDDRRTSPLRAHSEAPSATLVTADVWCRPCMLRECPIDHRCMTGITTARVYDTISPPPSNPR
jgi:lipopolysaccharide heptosyltransferase II